MKKEKGFTEIQTVYDFKKVICADVLHKLGISTTKMISNERPQGLYFMYKSLLFL